MKELENAERIDEGEFTLLLSQLAQQVMEELNNLNNMESQIQEYKEAGYRVEYYVTEDGTPAFKVVKKKRMGFKNE